MKIINYLGVIWISLAADSWAINPTVQVNEITKIITSESPANASKWILGKEEGTYDDIQFWATLKLRRIIQITSTEVVPERITLATIVYSASEEISTPSINIKNLIFGKERDNWKIIPNEFLELYLREGSESVRSKINSKTPTLANPNQPPFDIRLAAAVKQREEAEKAAQVELTKQFKALNLPTDKFLPGP